MSHWFAPSLARASKTRDRRGFAHVTEHVAAHDAPHMTYRLSESPSGRTRRWVRRKDPAFPMPWFARPLIIILSFILIATFAWQGVKYAWHLRSGGAAQGAPSAAATPSANAQPAASATPAGWQRDVIVSLDEAVRHASEVDLAPTETSLDHAASILAVARLKSQPAPPDFFDLAVSKLDEVLNAYHTNSRLTEHVTLARIELAQFRSSLEPLPPGTPASLNPADLLVHAATGGPPRTNAAPASQPAAAKSTAAKQPAADSARAAPDDLPPGHVFVGAPRTLAANSLLDPASLGGDFLDATAMPARSEILEPPSSRLFVDNVRVENLTIAGAAQTLDGIHWKNVVFVGTHLRYEGGELDLHNVRFIHCMFGFTSDERGARIATAIAQAQSSLVVE